MAGLLDGDALSFTPPVTAGEILDGKFRIGEVIGRGGMGVVVAAHHLDLDEPVALKFLHPAVASDEVAVERLLREARAVARLKKASVTHVFDVGRLRSGAPYIVMERLQGADLAAVLRARGRFTVADAARVIVEVCETLEEAHRQGIVHRDLKLQNLFLASTREGEVIKVLDFGISRLLDGDGKPISGGLTRANEIVGTPRFASPEQILEPHSVDARADVYGAGICLYTLLAGAPPFAALDLGELLRQVSTLVPRSLAELHADIPVAVAAIVQRCLEKAPAARFASAKELADALRPFARAVARDHIGDETIVAMQDGRLDEAHMHDVERHLASCNDCRLLIAAAAPARSSSPWNDLSPTRAAPLLAQVRAAHASDVPLASVVPAPVATLASRVPAPVATLASVVSAAPATRGSRALWLAAAAVTVAVAGGVLVQHLVARARPTSAQAAPSDVRLDATTEPAASAVAPPVLAPTSPAPSASIASEFAKTPPATAARAGDRKPRATSGKPPASSRGSVAPSTSAPPSTAMPDER